MMELTVRWTSTLLVARSVLGTGLRLSVRRNSMEKVSHGPVREDPPDLTTGMPRHSFWWLRAVEPRPPSVDTAWESDTCYTDPRPPPPRPDRRSLPSPSRPPRPWWPAL